MNNVVIVNPQARGGRVGKHWVRYQREINEIFGDTQVRMTEAPGHGAALVRQALRDGADRIIVAGGDGSMNEAVNGFFGEDGAALGKEACLALYPIGTGGDFARSIGLSDTDLKGALARARPKPIDIGRATFGKGADGPANYFVNISSFGSSGLVVDKVNSTSKRLGGKAAFAVGTLRGMASYRNRRVRLRIDDSFEEELKVNVVAVANGKFFGGGMKIAPDASLDDGEFDVVVVGDIGVTFFVRHSRRLYAGTHLDLPEIRAFRGKRVTATLVDDGEVLVEADGEQPGKLPVTYDILPKAIRLEAPWDDVH